MSFIAKKSLGQNFIKNQRVVDMMLRVAGIKNGDTVLEIGPGKGALTMALLGASAHVVAIEKDNRSMEFLCEKFANEIETGRLKIISGDVLEFNPEEMTGDYIIVANIPYYITGEFLRKFLESSHQPKKMVLMLQKEVAERIVADKTKESILSISVKAYGKPSYIETVPAQHFDPVPKVDSAIILIDDISKDFFIKNGQKYQDDKKNLTKSHFFNIVKAGFAHKRKILIKNLEKTIPKPVSKEILQKIWDRIGVSSTVRAEEISLEKWGQIATFIAHPDLL